MLRSQRFSYTALVRRWCSGRRSHTTAWSGRPVVTGTDAVRASSEQTHSKREDTHHTHSYGRVRRRGGGSIYPRCRRKIRVSGGFTYRKTGDRVTCATGGRRARRGRSRPPGRRQSRLVTVVGAAAVVFLGGRPQRGGQLPRGVGVVTDVLTSTVETEERTVDASDTSPTYVVLVEDGRVGVETFKASELKQTDFNTPVDNPPGTLAENYDSSGAILDRLADWLSAENTTFQYPESWRESDTPARVIALDAFASMGGSFDGCVREMRGEIRNPDAFCADFMDRLVGNEFWRGDSFLPGD